MRRRLMIVLGFLAVLGVGGCGTTGAYVDGTVIPDTAIGTSGTTVARSETTPPTTVDSADPLLRTLVGTEWEVVSLDGAVVSRTLPPFVLRFWGDGTFRFTGTCPEGSVGTYEVDGIEIRFDPEIDAATPAIGCLSVDDLLQSRLMSITDHGIDVSRYDDRQILARTVFPRAFDIVLRPTTTPPA